MSRIRQARVLGVAGWALIGLAAWMLAPRFGQLGAPSSLRILLFDASASVTRTRPSFVEDLAQELSSAVAGEGEAQSTEIAAAVFGAQVVAAFGPTPRSSLGAGELAAFARAVARVGGESSSDVAKALGFVSTLLEEDRSDRVGVEVYSDGVFTGADEKPLLESLGRAGVGVGLYPLPAPRLCDFGLGSLEMPERVQPGSPLAVKVELFANSACARAERSLQLEVQLSDASGERILSVDAAPVHASEGPGGVLRWSRIVHLGSLSAGRTSVSARLTSNVDPVPENDRAQAVVTAEGTLVCALVPPEDRRDAEARSMARAWLGGDEVFPGVEIADASLADLPALLEQVDVLATFDLRPSSLPREALERFLARGGGWLQCAGYSFLSDSRRDGTAWELLPLQPTADEEEERDILLVVDGSGSMRGEPFELARGAALELVGAAGSRDQVELFVFTSDLGGGEVLRPRGSAEDSSRGKALAALARPPQGPTDVEGALFQLARRRSGSGARRRTLAFLLSDGLSQIAPVESSRLSEALEGAGIQLCAVATGRNADRPALGRLLPPGQAVLEAADFEAMADLLRRAVHGDGLVEDGEPARSVAGAAKGQFAEALVEALRFENRDGFPGWSMHARLQAAEDAVVFVESSEGDPLLGLMQVGLGWSAVFASAPDWSPAWAGRFRSLIRLLGRTSEQSARSHLTTGGAELWLELAGDTVPAALSGRFLDPVSKAELGSVLFTPPVHADSLGERRSPFPDFLRGAGWVEVRLEDPRTREAVETLVFTAPPQKEFSAREELPAWVEWAPRESRRERLAAPREGVAALCAGMLLLFLSGWVLARPRFTGS